MKNYAETREYMHRSKAVKRYMTLNQQKELVKDTNTTALYIFNYYLSRCTTSSLGDKSVARALDLSESAVKKNRLLLTNNYYFAEQTVKGRNKMHFTYLGRPSVVEYLFFNELFGTEDIKVIRKLDYGSIVLGSSIPETAKQCVLGVVNDL